MRRLLLTAAAVLLPLVALPAHAGLFDDEEARKSIDDLRKQLGETGQRLGDVGKQAESLGRNQLEFANQLELLRSEIARLRGQAEVLTYELEAAQKRQKDFYVDLDNRVRKLETPPEPKPDATPKIDPAVETRDYEAAVAALKASNFKAAADGLQNFVVAYPKSAMLASAHYWAGYANAQLKDHAKAADWFGKFAAGWPDDERAPNALESQVASLEMLKNPKGARDALELLAAKYPSSDAGKRAKLKLKTAVKR